MSALRSASLLALFAGAAVAQAVTFDFETATVGQTLPLSLTTSEITANLTGGSGFRIQSGGAVPGFSGKYLVDNLTQSSTGSLTAAFSATQYAFASALSSDLDTIVTLNAYLGNQLVATQTATTFYPPNSGVGASYGAISLSSVAFDRVVLSSPRRFAVDNIVVTPEPSALAALAFGAVALLKRRKKGRGASAMAPTLGACLP